MEFLEELKLKIIARDPEFYNGQEVKKTVEELLFRSNELGNETGELMGETKKLARLQKGMRGAKSLDEFLESFQEEVGDVLISLVRLCEYFDVDLVAATKNKFNKTSEKYDCKIKF